MKSILFKIRRVVIRFLFSQNERIYIQQGLMSRMDELRNKKVLNSYWEAQDCEEDIIGLFEIKKLFRLDSKKHYEGYY